MAMPRGLLILSSIRCDMELSVVLLEYHSLNEIATAVKSIRIYEQDCEIVVSSNSLYSEKERQIAKETVPGVNWIFNAENGGFGYGMTMGARHTTGEYIVFLNSDVKLNGSLKPMVDYLKSHDEVGVIGPELVDDNGVVQDSYRVFVTPWNFVLRHMKRLLHVEKDWKQTRPIETDWVIGAFLMTKKKYFDIVGGFDYKRYFMYNEDMDLCYEMKLRGLSTVYYPLVSANYVGTRRARSSLKYAIIFIKTLCAFWMKTLFRKQGN